MSSERQNIPAPILMHPQTGSVLPASVLQTLAEYHARILATWPERGSRDHGSN